MSGLLRHFSLSTRLSEQGFRVDWCNSPYTIQLGIPIGLAPQIAFKARAILIMQVGLQFETDVDRVRFQI